MNTMFFIRINNLIAVMASLFGMPYFVYVAKGRAPKEAPKHELRKPLVNELLMRYTSLIASLTLK